MRQGANKRSRGRNNGRNKPHIPLRMQTFDSSGPDVRIRGNAWQVHERYMNMARDAFQAGDRVASENFFQHADHYYRLINTNEDGSPRHPQQGQQPPVPGGPQPGMEGGPEMGNDGPPHPGMNPHSMNPQGMQGGDQGPEGGYDQQDRPRDQQQDRRMNGGDPNGGNRGPRDQGREHQGREHQGREHQGREHQGRGRGGQDRGPDRGQERGPDRGPERSQERGPERSQDRGERPPRDQSREGLDRHLERHTNERQDVRGEQRQAPDRHSPDRHSGDSEFVDEPRRHPAAD